MSTTIFTIKNWIVEKWRWIALFLFLIIALSLSFGIGYLTARQLVPAPIIIEKCSETK